MSQKKIQKFFPEHSPPGNIEPKFNKIIVIDDCDVDLFINKTIIRAISLAENVAEEISPKKVLALLKNTERLSEVPELIFLDLEMKEMDGFEFLQEFELLSDFVRDRCKIVIVTSNYKKNDKHKAITSPSVIRYLTKPLDLHQVKDFIYS